MNDKQERTLSTQEMEQVAGEASRLMSTRGDIVLNAVDEGIYCLDTTGRTMFANEAAVRMLGFTLREMIGRSQHELIHHHYADGSVFPVEQCPIWGSATEGVHQRVGGDVFWRKDGTALPVDYTSTPIREARRVIAVVVTFRDTSLEQTARTQAARLAAEQAAREEAERGQVALQERDERFRALIAATGQIVWTNSADGRMVGEQQGWGTYTGQSQDEYNGYGWSAAVHPDDAAPTVDAWNAAVAARRPFVFQHRVRRHDGVYRSFAIRAIPLLEDDGTIREWVGSHTDVTEQLAARESIDRALAEASRARGELERLIEQAPAAIATLDGPEHVFRTANPRYRQLLGNRPLVGRTMRDALPELAEQPMLLDLLDEVYRTGTPHEGRGVPVMIDRTGTGKLEPGVFDFVYQPLLDESGVTTGILVHAVEIRAASP